MNCAAPSLAYIFAGKGVVLENSRVTCPSQPGSNGVTFTIMPHLAYVDLPKQITITLSGILKYSTVLAKAKEFGGITQILDFFDINPSFLKFLGSTIVEFTFVKILKSFDTLASYPYDESP